MDLQYCHIQRGQLFYSRHTGSLIFFRRDTPSRGPRDFNPEDRTFRANQLRKIKFAQSRPNEIYGSFSRALPQLNQRRTLSDQARVLLDQVLCEPEDSSPNGRARFTVMKALLHAFQPTSMPTGVAFLIWFAPVASGRKTTADVNVVCR